MATVVLVPRKLNIADLNRKAAWKLKNGSPKFKDVLRARCRARMKENRDKIVNKLRNIHPVADVEEFFSTIEELELVDMCPVEINGSVLTKEEEEIVAQYEALLASEEEMFSEMLEDEVICPMCQKTAMVMRGNCITCDRCCISIPTNTSLRDVGLHVRSCINMHGARCSNNPEFHLVPEDTVRVYMMCSLCSYLNILL